MKYSWLDWAPRQNQDEELLSGISDLQSRGHLGEDLRIIQEAGYGAVRCVAIDNESAVTRLVALGREENCFTSIEDEYIALLGLILTISRRLNGQRARDDPDEPEIVPAWL
jgi:hypothetical protein